MTLRQSTTSAQFLQRVSYDGSCTANAGLCTVRHWHVAVTTWEQKKLKLALNTLVTIFCLLPNEVYHALQKVQYLYCQICRKNSILFNIQISTMPK